MGVLLEKRTDAAPYPGIFFPLLRALFGSRRKTIKNNLTSFINSHFGKQLSAGVSSESICARVFSGSGLCGGERAETLEPEVFLQLANAILENLQAECKH